MFNNKEKIAGLTNFHNAVVTLDSKEKNLLQFLNEIPETSALNAISNQLHLLDDWVNYNIYKDKANAINLKWFVELLENGQIDTNNLSFEFEKIVHLNYGIKTIFGSSILNGFDAQIYQSQIEQFKKLHKEYTNLSQNALLEKLSARIPKGIVEAVQSSEIGILQRAIRNKGRGLSIRRLFDQIPNLIPRLKPCMLMSPISVAQYFDVNTEHFDLVIFDEASQLPTSEAVSALARAKQAIIVGDPKQMPPTSFFAANKVDDDNMELEDLESILDDCLSLSIPSNYLLRHYRSKHESLITFSNVNFYDNKLLTFPSPDDQNSKVTFEFIQNGFYDKGKTRTNKEEANAIINYLKRHFENQNPLSIGVVTFSQTQQSLIEDLLQKMFSQYPEIETIAMRADEPIFIKNLENVQGDERDIILFSVGYGPDETSRVSMNFGPLNRDGGWRRLNVAVTRARQMMKVFSSLKGDQIDLNRTKAEGVKGLKNFLNYAEKGTIVSAYQYNASKQKSLVDSISNALQTKGLICRTNIGASDYKIDIGIVDPKNNEDYLLAILLDSENYYNIHTTNDRELLAPNVLSNLGWNIYRIWTLDWIKNKEKIVEDILATLERINSNTVKEPDIAEELKMTKHQELPIVEVFKMISYLEANVRAVSNADSETIYLFENRAKLLRQMETIIEQEAPISEYQLFRKILTLWNTSRTGAKLNNHLKEISASIPGVITNQSLQIFYWSAQLTPDNLQHYRDNTEIKRSLDDIAKEELAVAIMEIMQNNLSLSKEDLFRATSKIFGFSKMGNQIESSLQLGLQYLKQNGKLTVENNRVILL